MRSSCGAAASGTGRSFGLAKGGGSKGLRQGAAAAVVVLWQKVAWHKECIGKKGWNHCASNYGGHEMLILGLVDYAMIQPENGGNGTKGQSGGHHQGVLQSLLPSVIKCLHRRKERQEFGNAFGKKQHCKNNRSGRQSG